MKKILFRFLYVLIFSLPIDAHADIKNYFDPTQPIKVNSASPQFTITQPANPTTGYRWRIVSYDNQLLNLVSSYFQPPKKLLPGAGGNLVWTFQANSAAFHYANNTEIKLAYERPWAPQDHPTEVVFTVMTQP